MRLGGIADHLVEIHNRDDLLNALDWATERGLPTIMIGGGSNIVWQDTGFQGLVMVNKILGYQDETLEADEHRLTIGAGEPWDSVVARSVQAGLTGIEALSLIPGTAGATPIQNVGAYGQDISQTLESLEALDLQTNTFVTLSADDCDFAYRSSRFKTTDRGRFFIVTLCLRLKVGNPLPPYYGAVQAYLEAHPATEAITPAVLRDAVIAIRSAKLPDPEMVANNGSFFANPVVSDQQLQSLLRQYPEMPHWPLEAGGAKLPAAWLIEQAGFKDYHDEATGMATWPKQPLVLVNEHARATADLLSFKAKLVSTVADRFGVTLIQEPEILP
jgi:UDP-N-acetylmuramate dehydrogenase